jgi:hypothetical protein
MPLAACPVVTMWPVLPTVTFPDALPLPPAPPTVIATFFESTPVPAASVTLKPQLPPPPPIDCASTPSAP